MITLVKKRKWILINLSLVVMVAAVISCSKNSDPAEPSAQSANADKVQLLSFLIRNGAADQTFSISCTCLPTFTLDASPTALYYGTVTSTYVQVTNTDYTATLYKGSYYYVIPSGGSYGSSTKCLKVKFITGNNKPAFDYNSSTNTWSGLVSNSDIDATQINKSSVPACTICLVTTGTSQSTL